MSLCGERSRKALWRLEEGINYKKSLQRNNNQELPIALDCVLVTSKLQKTFGDNLGNVNEYGLHTVDDTKMLFILLFDNSTIVRQCFYSFTFLFVLVPEIKLWFYTC